MKCPDEEELSCLLFAPEPRGSGRGALLFHVEGCDSCQELVALIARGGLLTPGDVGPEEPPGDAADDVGATGSESDLGAGSRAGRYLIEEVLGRGGMGVVHRAWDPQLNRRIAIKVLRADREEGRLRSHRHERMLQEANALARVAHPHVCAIYDVGALSDGQIFLAMELVEGPTLRAWLAQARRRRGEILGVFLQAAEGLAAAHATAVVHRDFKPDNVMLAAGGRAVVMDFGLAGAAPGQGTQAHAVQERLGTPRYMAPEQHRGDVVDARADQFSFAVALYEALYRRSPFAGADRRALREAMRAGRLRRPPLLQACEPLWPVLRRALSARPEERFRDMAALCAALRRAAAAPRRALLYAFASILLVSTLTPRLVPRSAPSEAEVEAEAAAPAAHREPLLALAVIGPSAEKELLALCAALREGLTSELLRTGVSVSEGRDANEARLDEGLPEDAPPSPRQLHRLRRTLSARLVLWGDLERRGQGVRWRLRVAGPAGTVDLPAVDGRAEQAADLVARATAAVREQLGLPPGPPGPPALPDDSQAVQDLGAAVRLLGRPGQEEAIALIARALSRAPDHAGLLLADVEVRWALGIGPVEAERSLSRVLDSPGLTEEQRSFVRGLLHRFRGQEAEAGQVLAALARAHPLRLRYTTEAVAALVGAGRAAEAAALLSELSAAQPLLAFEPRVRLSEAHAALFLSDSARQAAAASAAASEARARGRQRLLCQARLKEAEARLALGALSATEEAAREAEAVCEKTLQGQQQGEAALLLAQVHEARGELLAAARTAAPAIERIRRAGNMAVYAARLGQLSWLHLSLGDLAGAERSCSEASRLGNEVGNRHLVASCQLILGRAALWRGHLDAAGVLAEKAREAGAAMNDDGMVGRAHALRAEIYWERGDAARTRAAWEEWTRLGAAVGARDASLRNGVMPARLLSVAGRAREAEEVLRAALLRGRAALGEPAPPGLIPTRVQLAEVLLVQGRSKEALAELSQVGEGGEGQEDRILSALSRAAALSRTGQTEAARTLLARRIEEVTPLGARLWIEKLRAAAQRLGPARASR